MIVDRRRLLLGASAMAAAASVPLRARAQDKPIRIGVLSDMSGPFSADTGPGSLVSAQLAVEDFRATNPGFDIEILSGDMQSKPDLVASISSSWYEWDGVDMIVDVPLSSGAFAVAGFAERLNKVAIFTGAGSSDITGKSCGPNHVHWVYDTYANARAISRSLIGQGKDSWYFIQADYAFGENLVRDASAEILAAGGKILGVDKHPSPNTSDFSSFLMSAQAANPKVLALANSSVEAATCLKQALEFGIQDSGITIAALQFAITMTHATGLEVVQGLNIAETYYWDLNDGTRDFAMRWEKQRPGLRPNPMQAGVYSAVLHYLKAVAAAGVDVAKNDGAAVVRKMKEIPTDDPLFGKGLVREDGRKIHDYHLFQVKKPSESTQPWDYYHHVASLPAAEAFRPLADGGCPMIPT